MSDTADNSTLEVGFALGKKKTIYVVGTYDFKNTSNLDRLRYWTIVSGFGQELGAELTENYGATLMRLNLCEVDPGNIMFEIETDVSASVRRKAIEAVQAKVEDDVDIIDPENKPTHTKQNPEPNLCNVNGPDIPQ